jgi:hypothetical protein
MLVERFLDHLGAAACRAAWLGSDHLTEPGHRLVGVIERQSISPRDVHALLPGAGVAIGAGDHQPMQHGEVDRALDIEAEAALARMAAQHVTATGLGPQPTEYQIRTDAAPTQLGELATIETGQHD